MMKGFNYGITLTSTYFSRTRLIKLKYLLNNPNQNLINTKNNPVPPPTISHENSRNYLLHAVDLNNISNLLISPITTINKAILFYHLHLINQHI